MQAANDVIITAKMNRVLFSLPYIQTCACHTFLDGLFRNKEGTPALDKLINICLCLCTHWWEDFFSEVAATKCDKDVNCSHTLGSYKVIYSYKGLVAP